MYSNSFVAAVKVDGKILREFKDTIYLKFGSEYSILLKNLESRRAVAKIFIDGQEVCAGGFVIEPNREVEIERFVNDLSQGNRFKFIEKTAGVEAHRGNKIEDGLIRIEFEFEQAVYPYVPNKVYYRHPEFYGKVGSYWSGGSECYGQGEVLCSSHAATASNAANGLRSMVPQNMSVKNDAGITVPGSISNQKFTVTHCNTDGIKHSMIFKVLGSADGAPIEAPITVAVKPKCITCGKVNRATNKFCSECGTSLQIA